MVFRFFSLVVIAFLVYWIAKGTFRRLFAPIRKGRGPRSMRKGPARPVVEKKEKNAGIDYSKVKDASYRDLK